MDELENMEELHHEELHNDEEEIVEFHDANEQKKKKKGKFLNILSNVIFVPVIIILVVYLVYAVNIQKQNGVPSFFGQSYVRVLTGSMRNSGFERGDVVVLERVKISQIKEGNIIAFYDSSIKSTNAIPTLLTEKPATAKDFKTGKETYQSRIVFHHVIGIYYDSAGNTWFETKGSSNASADDTLVRGDYVVGQYKDSVMADIIEFISSSRGMIILIIIPSSILLFILLLNIIEIVDQMMREKKEKGALVGDVKERELEVTTIIEEHSDEEKKARRKRKSKAKEDEEF